ncbi:hypothetical protein FRB96_004350 [Tulasnella sp. 330]|nr:hypothetical protein FRB96_004350 [Tulasnella sp. 330]KAG8878186.1 hypothetical protein FRB98_006330 [Tulasnella sp. 332]
MKSVARSARRGFLDAPMTPPAQSNGIPSNASEILGSATAAVPSTPTSLRGPNSSHSGSKASLPTFNPAYGAGLLLSALWPSIGTPPSPVPLMETYVYQLPTAPSPYQDVVYYGACYSLNCCSSRSSLDGDAVSPAKGSSGSASQRNGGDGSLGNLDNARDNVTYGAEFVCASHHASDTSSEPTLGDASDSFGAGPEDVETEAYGDIVPIATPVYVSSKDTTHPTHAIKGPGPVDVQMAEPVPILSSVEHEVGMQAQNGLER